MSTVVFAVGARPNFVKMAPVIEAVGRRGLFRQLVVHTGQHYDERMSTEILDDLAFRSDRFLGIGSGSQQSTGFTLIAFERVLLEEQPDLVVVSGDVNATLACSLAASKLGVPVAHVESGLRSNDWSMPEEQNRVLTDRLSELLFTHSPDANENLLAEGIAQERIHYVGNTMIDTLRRLERDARARRSWERFGAEENDYALVTLHRPSNVDQEERLRRSWPPRRARPAYVVPSDPPADARGSPRGRAQRPERAGVVSASSRATSTSSPLESGAGMIVTDSGGLQEEAAALGVPCYTLRPNTERPITIVQGTNTLIGDDPAAIASLRPSGEPPAPCAVPLWDGHAAERVADVIAEAFGPVGAIATSA
jgi:UDP-N-acetylglucosamine 2-epimerase (non-hydrolysing)